MLSNLYRQVFTMIIVVMLVIPIFSVQAYPAYDGKQGIEMSSISSSTDLLSGVPMFVAPPSPVEVLVDDFDGVTPLASWTLETSGLATGSFTLGTGFSKQGGQIAYDIDNGEYVKISKTLSTPISADAISLWVKTPSRVQVKIGLVEVGSSDEWTSTSSRSIYRPFYAVNADDWYRLLVRFPNNSTMNIQSISFYVTVLDSTWTVSDASGTVLLDEINLLQGVLNYSLQPENLSVTPAFEYKARTFHDIFGMDYNQRDGIDMQATAIMDDVGVNILRTDVLRWHAAEGPRGVYDFSVADGIVVENRARGITTLINIGGGNAEHTGAWNKPPLSTEELIAFGNYVQAIAGRYSGYGLFYDIWSEPAINVWDPPLSAAQFAAIVQVARQRIRAVDPTAKVISGGILNANPEYTHDFLVAGGADGLDGFGVHNYNSTSESFGETSFMLREEFTALGLKPLPIWDTEWGFSSYSPDPSYYEEYRLNQAKYTVRHFLSAWANGLHSAVYWHLREESSMPTAYDAAGLIDYYYNDKPVMQAIRVLSDMGGQRVLTGWLNDLPSDCHGLQLDGTYDVVFAIWCSNPLTIQLPNSSTVIDYMGKSVSMTPHGDYSSIELDWGVPVYITCSECEQLQHFTDVPITQWAWSYIERLYGAGITGGCSTSPLNYCPENQVTRAQMAVFLEKGLHYPYSYTAPDVAPTFMDTVGHWAEDWIEALKSDGVTAGCAIGLYCPENPVTRAQMAVFLLKAKYGASYTPLDVGTSTGFGDVPITHWAAAWIKQLAAEGITGGCGGGNYCPESPVTRAQMAVFLVKAFGLP